MKYGLAAAALLAGCMALGKVPPREFYVLNDLGTATVSMRGTQNDRALLISQTSVSPFYDTQSLVFSRTPGQRAYYQFAAWTERPGSRLTELLIHRLYARGSFRSVAATTAGGKGDLVLNTRLEELCHDASAGKGTVRIEMSAVLVDRAERGIVAQHTFTQSAPTGGDTAAAAVVAFDRAVTALLDEESAWVEDMAARPAQR